MKVADGRIDRALRADDVAQLLGVSTVTLERWRFERRAGVATGPPYIRVEGSVRYLESEVLAYREACRKP